MSGPECEGAGCWVLGARLYVSNSELLAPSSQPPAPVSKASSPTIRDHLTRLNFDVHPHRFIALRLDFDLVHAGGERQRLRRAVEILDRPA